MAPTNNQPGAAPGSWRLAPDIAAATQGLIASPFSDLPEGEALFLTLPQGSRGAWLKTLRAAITITPATGPTRPDPSAAIAFTASGLKVMGLDDAVVRTFSIEFREGMHQFDRRRRLGDDDPKAVIANGPIWSGNIEDPIAPPEHRSPGTPVTVHAALLLYAIDGDSLANVVRTATSALHQAGVVIAHRLPLLLRPDPDGGTPREHFGFADGISQPAPFGDAIQTPGGVPYPKDPWHGIAAGDILMGQLDSHQQVAPGPLVAGTSDAGGILPTAGAPTGFHNLGRNGSYLVIRELRQDVAAFWKNMDREAATLNQPGIDANWMAERVVGRGLDGTPLLPASALPSDPNAAKMFNAFGFFVPDQFGRSCPFGSHMRRSNPRDGLGRTAADGTDLLKSVNSHRILRRGRKYGETIADRRVDDGKDRGLLFMCLNTDIARQFEFTQQTWLVNPGFASLHGETDPLLGPAGPFTIPAEPFRYRPNVETYIHFAGGEYFFLPSLPALNYLGSL